MSTEHGRRRQLVKDPSGAHSQRAVCMGKKFATVALGKRERQAGVFLL